MGYATDLNDQRVEAIKQSNPNVSLLRAHVDAKLTMNKEEVEQMVNAKVDELWAGATTREEALAALGRAWAEGYTLWLEPVVTLLDGVPTWQLNVKIPSYVNETHFAKHKEFIWQLMAPRKSVRMNARRTHNVLDDLSIIVNAMNIGINYIEIADEAADMLQDKMTTEWNTVEGIRNEIVQAVTMIDGAIVNDDCVADYNTYLAQMKDVHGFPSEIVLKRDRIANHIEQYMGNLYVLNDYNSQYISPAMRQKYAKWCQKFSDTMRQRIETNTWLENTTRQHALEKIDKVVYYVGGINVIPDCVLPTLTGNTLIDDARQLRKARLDGFCWAVKQTRSTCAKLLDNLQYFGDATIDNASYMQSSNIVNINPSNLCSPYVDDNYEDALQWAFIGTTIGHELTHGFDSNGSKYDQWGNMVNWWTDDDATKFKALCDQLTDQFDHLQLMPWVDPTLCGDGKNTLGENIADLGGCCLALQILLEERPNATAAEKKALARRYFQGWAIQWSNTYGFEFAQMMKERDVHSLSRERTNGIVRNVDAWYDAYDIKSGTLYLKPSERVHIW